MLSTNRLTSGYDANGNMLTGYGLTMTYDGRNRVTSAAQMGGTEYYGYAPDNKRIYRWNPTTGTEEWTFYGIRGERIGSFGLNTSGTYYFYGTETNVWFGGKLISKMPGTYITPVVRDRLGTDREGGAQYYPYGDEITSTANGTEKYGTYFRDSFTTMDYADQRYYVSSYGRFTSVDPDGASERRKDPGSWNRYSYVLGDPLNRSDPSGMNEFASPCEGFVDDCSGDDGGWDGGGFATLGGDSGVPNICLTNPTFALAHAVACGLIIAPEPPTGSVSQPSCDGADNLSADQVLAVATVMGENSYYLLGKSPYSGAPAVTSAAVSLEDVDMFSVFVNRTQAAGFPSTIGAVATQPKQFGGFNAGPTGGIAKFDAAVNSTEGSSPCNDLTDVVNAMNYVLANGSQLDSSYLFWKAINQGGGVMHQQQPGDIYVANTAFGLYN